MNKDPKKWLLAWFSKRANIGKERIAPGLNYLERGLIDSFTFITLISEIEQEFHIQLSDEDFRSKEFSTIKGLASIIEKKII